ncbi:hypothetical protein NLJ89_g10035 [Agrocybe chaxingu]|uniref:Uncharacterized protein n=1 Tax=Agrocybe chaxingu TaxID=84603 RepID=A0A9W8JRB7_9AGAR|nr:hypothetical protein NLJ89_g10035 [Agrocybe chaxingu]
MHLQPAFAFAVADVLLGAHDAPTARLLDRRGAPTMVTHRMPAFRPPPSPSSTLRPRTDGPALISHTYPTSRSRHSTASMTITARWVLLPRHLTEAGPFSDSPLSPCGYSEQKQERELGTQRAPNDHDAEGVAPSQAHTTALAVYIRRRHTKVQNPPPLGLLNTAGLFAAANLDGDGSLMTRG